MRPKCTCSRGCDQRVSDALCPSVCGATQPAAGALWKGLWPGNHCNPRTQHACTYSDCKGFGFDQNSLSRPITEYPATLSDDQRWRLVHLSSPNKGKGSLWGLAQQPCSKLH